jgi:hypothetical protein
LVYNLVVACGEPHLQLVEPVLLLSDVQLRAEAVFEKQELAARFQHPIYFGQGLAHVLDAAQRKRADGPIEGATLKRESFAAENPLVNLDLRPPDPSLRQSLRSGVRIDSGDPANLGWIVWQVQARAEAELVALT